MARLGKIPMRYDGWNADYPDAENYMQLLYGPNSGGENNARFKLPAFDALYDETRKLPDSPQRTRLFDKMMELVFAYAPFQLSEHRLEDPLMHGSGQELQAAPDSCAGVAIRRPRSEEVEIGQVHSTFSSRDSRST